MNPENIRRLDTELETNRRREVVEMHLFDDDAAEEEALCQVGASVDYIRSAMCYLEDRLHGARVGVVCQGCKERAIPFAVTLAKDLKFEGLMDEAEEYRRACRETAEGNELLDGRPALPYVGVFCVSQPVSGAPKTLGEGRLSRPAVGPQQYAILSLPNCRSSAFRRLPTTLKAKDGRRMAACAAGNR